MTENISPEVTDEMVEVAARENGESEEDRLKDPSSGPRRQTDPEDVNWDWRA